MTKLWIAIGGLLGFLGVGLGAFGAHGLQGRLSERDLEIFETAVRYHLVHAVALLAVGAMPRSPFTTAAGWAFTGGVAVFSGSLYLLVLTQTRWLGAITPLGGLALMAGWLFLLIGALRA